MISDRDVTCDQCGGPNLKAGRFCADKCRAAWHRTHDPACVVRSVRRLKHGGVAVVVHFADAEAERALHFSLGQNAVLGAVDGDAKGRA